MSKMTIKNIEINYKIIDNNSNNNIVFLHGWGGNSNSFLPVARQLDKYNSYLIDLPGFGESSLPNTVFSSYDYAKIIKNFISNLKINNITLVGHSFGGKIASIIASENPSWLSSLVIISAPGIKYQKPLSIRWKIFLYKSLSRFFKILGLKNIINSLSKKFGSDDYRNSHGIMREILKNIVNEDISNDIKNISKKTLIIWGENDDSVPLIVGKKYNEFIKNSELIVYPNARHFPFLESFDKFLNDLKKFLGEIYNE